MIVADTSPHGLLAVSKLRSNTELPKHLWKKLAQVEKDLAHRRPQSSQYGGSKKKFDGFPRNGQNFPRRRPGPVALAGGGALQRRQVVAAGDVHALPQRTPLLPGVPGILGEGPGVEGGKGKVRSKWGLMFLPEAITPATGEDVVWGSSTSGTHLAASTTASTTFLVQLQY